MHSSYSGKINKGHSNYSYNTSNQLGINIPMKTIGFTQYNDMNSVNNNTNVREAQGFVEDVGQTTAFAQGIFQIDEKNRKSNTEKMYRQKNNEKILNDMIKDQQQLLIEGVNHKTIFQNSSNISTSNNSNKVNQSKNILPMLYNQLANHQNHHHLNQINDALANSENQHQTSTATAPQGASKNRGNDEEQSIEKLELKRIDITLSPQKYNKKITSINAHNMNFQNIKLSYYNDLSNNNSRIVNGLESKKDSNIVSGSIGVKNLSSPLDFIYPTINENQVQPFGENRNYGKQVARINSPMLQNQNQHLNPDFTNSKQLRYHNGNRILISQLQGKQEQTGINGSGPPPISFNNYEIIVQNKNYTNHNVSANIGKNYDSHNMYVESKNQYFEQQNELATKNLQNNENSPQIQQNKLNTNQVQFGNFNHYGLNDQQIPSNVSHQANFNFCPNVNMVFPVGNISTKPVAPSLGYIDPIQFRNVQTMKNPLVNENLQEIVQQQKLQLQLFNQREKKTNCLHSIQQQQQNLLQKNAIYQPIHINLPRGNDLENSQINAYIHRQNNNQNNMSSSGFHQKTAANNYHGNGHHFLILADQKDNPDATPLMSVIPFNLGEKVLKQKINYSIENRFSDENRSNEYGSNFNRHKRNNGNLNFNASSAIGQGNPPDNFDDNGQLRFFVGPGNNAELIRQILLLRDCWVDVGVITRPHHFRWTMWTGGYRFSKLNGGVRTHRQVYNHFEFHSEISTKSGLIQNLMILCETNKIPLFTLTPSTFLLDFNDETCEIQLTKFLLFYYKHLPNSPYQRQDQIRKQIMQFKQKTKPLMNFINCDQQLITLNYCKPKMTPCLMDGDSYLWFLKPTGFNCGRGIEVFSQLDTLEQYIFEYCQGQKDQLVVDRIQKQTSNQEQRETLKDEDEKESIQFENLCKLEQNRENTDVDGQPTDQSIVFQTEEENAKNNLREIEVKKSTLDSRNSPEQTALSPQGPKNSLTRSLKQSSYNNKKEARLEQKKTLRIPLNGAALNSPPVEPAPYDPNLIRTCTFVIQKYIEKPLLINNRKFDIRIWVLVTQDMDVLIFKQGYIRTSSEQFKLDRDCIDNYFIHLTNNAVQKFADNYGQFENGNQVSYDDFEELFMREGRKIEFREQILPKIKQYVLLSMTSVKRQLNSENRQYCFEIFGYDFIIDNDLNPWLIQVNTNPCIQQSSKLLSMLIPRMIDDAFKLTLDVIFSKPRAHVFPQTYYPAQKINPSCSTNNGVLLINEGQPITSDAEVQPQIVDDDRQSPVLSMSIHLENDTLQKMGIMDNNQSQKVQENLQIQIKSADSNFPKLVENKNSLNQIEGEDEEDYQQQISCESKSTASREVKFLDGQPLSQIELNELRESRNDDNDDNRNFDQKLNDEDINNNNNNNSKIQQYEDLQDERQEQLSQKSVRVQSPDERTFNNLQNENQNSIENDPKTDNEIKIENPPTLTQLNKEDNKPTNASTVKKSQFPVKNYSDTDNMWEFLGNIKPRVFAHVPNQQSVK